MRSFFICISLVLPTSAYTFYGQIGGGATLWSAESPVLKSFADAQSTATGISETFPNQVLAPNLVLGVTTPMLFTVINWDLRVTWANQALDQAGLHASTQNLVLELSPKIEFFNLGSWLYLFWGPTIGWSDVDGRIELGTDNSVHFSGNTFTAGSLIGTHLDFHRHIRFTLLGGYRSGATKAFQISAVSGNLFKNVNVGDELQVSEIGQTAQSVSMDISGWYVQTSLSFILL
jgi:hypothetical protein